jgi:hypothetical protein
VNTTKEKQEGKWEKESGETAQCEGEERGEREEREERGERHRVQSRDTQR